MTVLLGSHLSKSLIPASVSDDTAHSVEVIG